jgi:hypothetical protein
LSALATAFVAFASCCGAALAGMALRFKVPDSHLDGDSRDVVKLVMGLIATMSALVLGLLIASAKSSHDTQVSELQQISAHMVQLDRILALYGPEAQDTREMFKQAVTMAHDQVWPPDDHQAASLDPKSMRGQGDAFYQSLQNLTPQTDAQRRGQNAALELAASVSQTRALMFEQLDGSVSWPLLTVLIFWVSMIFLGFGLFARFHLTTNVALIGGAVAVASAIFLIMELSQPYAGSMRISDAPLRSALGQMDR